MICAGLASVSTCNVIAIAEHKANTLRRARKWRPFEKHGLALISPEMYWTHIYSIDHVDIIWVFIPALSPSNAK